MFLGVGHVTVVTLYLINLKLCCLLPFHQSSLMSLVQGHVACQSFALKRPHTCVIEN